VSWKEFEAATVTSMMVRDMGVLGHFSYGGRSSKGKVFGKEALDVLRGFGFAVEDDEGCPWLVALGGFRGFLDG
jgi:hypothetical protein